MVALLMWPLRRSLSEARPVSPPNPLRRNSRGLAGKNGQEEWGLVPADGTGSVQIRGRNAGRRICLHTSAAAVPDLLQENSGAGLPRRRT